MSLAGSSLFWIYISPILLGMLAMPVLLVLHFLMPRAVLDRYWKAPHFRPMEIALFTNTIYAPMRTVMLMGVIAFPSLGKKRKITEAHTLSPRWYRVASKVHVMAMLASFVGIFVMMAILSMDLWLSGESHSAGLEMTVAFLVSIACFGGVAINQWRLRRREGEPADSRTAEKRKPSAPTLAQLRPVDSTFVSSPQLYVVTTRPDPDEPYSSIYLSRERGGVNTMMVYLSPIDAVLDAPSFADTFAIEPLENLVDSPDFVPVPGGHLSVHLVYGFGAVGERVIMCGEMPVPLSQLVHFDLAPDAAKPFRLQVDAATCAWLEQLHADVGMEDYSATVRLLDDGPYEDLARRHGAVAFLWMRNARKNIKTVRGITHCALYDILDQRWRFTTVPEDRIRAMFPEMASLEEAAVR